jgi:ABC-type multidrug transport system fused ATPase/permease subunit
MFQPEFEQSEPMKHQLIFTTYRKSILLAISFVLVEKIAWIIEPTVFGNVIDAMIDALATPSLGSPMIPILIWISVFAVNSGVGTYRRYRDEKIYLNVYNDLAANIARKVWKGSMDASRAAARAELSRELIEFYQYRVPDLIEQFIDIGGAIIALALFDWRLGAACATILVPVVSLSWMYNKKVSSYQKQIHDQQEDLYRVYATNDIQQVQSYNAEMARWKQKIANRGAINFGILRVFLLGIFLIILYVAIDLDNFTTGNIYSIAAYVWTFVTSSEYMPEQLESITSVKEISERLRAEEDE